MSYNNQCNGRRRSAPVPVVTNSCPVGGRLSEAVSNMTETCCTGPKMKDFSLAMAYVPWQQFTDFYSVEEALYQGTIFKKLDLDFVGRRSRK